MLQWGLMKLRCYVILCYVKPVKRVKGWAFSKIYTRSYVCLEECFKLHLFFSYSVQCVPNSDSPAHVFLCITLAVHMGKHWIKAYGQNMGHSRWIMLYVWCIVYLFYYVYIESNVLQPGVKSLLLSKDWNRCLSVRERQLGVAQNAM